MAAQDVETTGSDELVTEEEIDRMIEAEAEAEHQKELGRLSGLRSEIASLKGQAEKKKE